MISKTRFCWPAVQGEHKVDVQLSLDWWNHQKSLSNTAETNVLIFLKGVYVKSCRNLDWTVRVLAIQLWEHGASSSEGIGDKFVPVCKNSFAIYGFRRIGFEIYGDSSNRKGIVITPSTQNTEAPISRCCDAVSAVLVASCYQIKVETNSPAGFWTWGWNHHRWQNSFSSAYEAVLKWNGFFVKSRI